jgi:hypothetical protein
MAVDDGRFVVCAGARRDELDGGTREGIDHRESIEPDMAVVAYLVIPIADIKAKEADERHRQTGL